MAPSGPLLLLLVLLARARAGPSFRLGRGCRLPLRGDQLSGLGRRWAARGPAPPGAPGGPAASPGLPEPGALPPLTFEGQIQPLCFGGRSFSLHLLGWTSLAWGLRGVVGGSVVPAVGGALSPSHPGGVGSPMELGSPGDWGAHSPPVLFWGREWALMVLVSISSQDLPPAS